MNTNFDKKSHLLVFKHLQPPTVSFLSLLLVVVVSIGSIGSTVSIDSIAPTASTVSNVPVLSLLLVIVGSTHLLFLNTFPLLFAHRLEEKQVKISFTVFKAFYGGFAQEAKAHILL